MKAECLTWSVTRKQTWISARSLKSREIKITSRPSKPQSLLLFHCNSIWKKLKSCWLLLDLPYQEVNRLIRSYVTSYIIAITIFLKSTKLCSNSIRCFSEAECKKTPLYFILEKQNDQRNTATKKILGIV